jgi:hypothetical protein
MIIMVVVMMMVVVVVLVISKRFVIIIIISKKSKVRCDLPLPRNLQRCITFKESRKHWELFMLRKCKQRQKSENKHILTP